MSRFPRLRRGPDQWSDPHERARRRLAERPDGPLGLSEASWLDEHLAACASCAAIASAYDEDRLALRALRDDPPDPPRDLWARTAAAIEASAAGNGRTPEERVRRNLPLGALSGLAVVAIMVGVGLISANLPLGSVGGGSGDSSPIAGGEGQASSRPSASILAEATPIAVAPGVVGYLDKGGGGLYRLSVNEVCPTENKSGCPTVREGSQVELAIRSPKTIVADPSRLTAVAISDTAAGDEVVVVDLPQATDRPRPTSTPATTAAPTPTATTEPASSAAASTPPDPSPTAPSPSASTEPPIATIEPSATPTATAAQRIAIASGIEVVGESAAFSRDGSWFAFTARPTGQTSGADVYAWRVGSDAALPVTDDGTSYFASWSRDELIVSRPDDPTAKSADPVSLRIDPANGTERDAGRAWRPAIDPTGTRAILWIGTLKLADDGVSWVPDRGTLELRRWSADGHGRGEGPERQRVVTDAAPHDFDIRWDESGEWVAVWVADADDPVVGRLTLYHVDADKDRLERIDGAPIDVPALPGFSIGDGRLAWATPRGQGGEGSRIQIAAWSKTDVGIVESSPGDDPVVIR
jgi:hypothetical protein